MRRSSPIAAAIGLITTLAACGGSGPETAPTTTTSMTATAAEATVRTTTTNAPRVGPAIERNLVYATRSSDGVALTLDMYIPAEPEGAPIVLDAPVSLVNDGVIVVTFDDDDHLGDDPAMEPSDFPVDDTHPGAIMYNGRGAPIREVADRFACAIHLARARAFELGNRDPIVVLNGVSAGAGAAMHVALFGDTLESRWDEFAAVGGPPRQFDCAVTGGSTHVDAAVGTAGGYALWVPIFDELYGQAYLQEHDPKLLAFLSSSIGANPDVEIRLIHGIYDDGVPFDNSVLFAAALADAGYEVGEVIPFAGGHVKPPDTLAIQTIKELIGQ